MNCLNRLRKELQQLTEEPPPGISVWAVNDNLKHLRAGFNLLYLHIP